MSTTIPDLWPEVSVEPEQPSPVSILRQQGLLLGKRTENLVYGEVQSRAHASWTFAHLLEIVAPSLAYRRPLVVAYHEVKAYPAKIGRPHPDQTYNHLGMPTMIDEKKVNSSDEFIDALRAILQAEDTVKLLQTLIDQCREPTPLAT